MLSAMKEGEKILAAGSKTSPARLLVLIFQCPDSTPRRHSARSHPGEDACLLMLFLDIPCVNPTF